MSPAPITGGVRAWRALAAGAGRVLCRFERSLYLESAAGLCCVCAPDLPPGPLNLLLPAAGGATWAPGHVTAGTRWHCDGTTLSLGTGVQLSLAARRTWRAPRPSAAGGDLSAVWSAAVPEEAAMTPPAGQPGWQRTAAALQAGSDALGRWLEQTVRDPARAPPVPCRVASLIGCGPGLTPSGDDVLVGALIALHGLGQRTGARRLARWVRAKLPGRTGRVSAAHLLAACAGEAVAPVHDVVGALGAGCVPALAAARRALRAHGHRSGHDALVGIGLVALALADNRRPRPARRWCEEGRKRSPDA